MGWRTKILIAKEKSQEVQEVDAIERLHAENDQMRQQMQDLHEKLDLLLSKETAATHPASTRGKKTTRKADWYGN